MEDIQQYIKECFTEILRVQITIDQDLQTLGCDSLDSTEISYLINDKYDTDIKGSTLLQLNSIFKISEHIYNLIPMLLSEKFRTFFLNLMLLF